MSLIKCKNLSKDYKTGSVVVKALHDVSFEINESAFISFVGPSGSGKTTLLNILGCLDRPTSGDVKISDTEVSTLNRKQGAIFRGANIGFIFQDFNLMPVLTVWENIEYPLIIVKETKEKDIKDRITMLLESVGMTREKDKYPDELSGGQKQRVAIARALVTNPKLVLADEPTANLDSKTAYSVINLMKNMKDNLKTTFIFSTHDHKVVNEAEKIFNLQDGKLIG
jgi:putative ABC transport system ATP-binding protein